MELPHKINFPKHLLSSLCNSLTRHLFLTSCFLHHDWMGTNTRWFQREEKTPGCSVVGSLVPSVTSQMANFYCFSTDFLIMDKFTDRPKTQYILYCYYYYYYKILSQGSLQGSLNWDHVLLKRIFPLIFKIKICIEFLLCFVVLWHFKEGKTSGFAQNVSLSVHWSIWILEHGKAVLFLSAVFPVLHFSACFLKTQASKKKRK